MQFEITDRAAIVFAQRVLLGAGRRLPVDAAVTQARLAVFANDNDVEWGTPVLYLRVEDGRMFDIANAGTLPRVAPEILPPKGGVAVAATTTAASVSRLPRFPGRWPLVIGFVAVAALLLLGVGLYLQEPPRPGRWTSRQAGPSRPVRCS